jgi:hypothetical protein
VIAGLLLTVDVAARAQQHRPMEVPGQDQAQAVTGRTGLILKDEVIASKRLPALGSTIASILLSQHAEAHHPAQSPVFEKN